MKSPKLFLQSLFIFLCSIVLISCGAGKNAEPPLHDAALRGDVKRVEQLIKSGVSVHSRNGEGATPLHWAAFKGQVGVAKILLGYGANINELTTKGSTPLRLAMTHKKTEMITYLKGQGGLEDVNQ